MAHEAQAIVPLRRNHPALVAWCGGNELEGPDGPLDDATPVLGALRDVVARLDPDRAWLPTSPSGPRSQNRLDVIEADPAGLHDVHGPWEHQGLRGQYEVYDRGTSLFNSEFGVEGMTNERTLDALIPEDQRWPATRRDRVYRHLGDWWNNEPLVQSAFGERLTDLATLRRASQHLQADGLRYAIEANRRRAFRNSGSVPWQFNESYPNAWCTSAVDHRGDPKPAYFAVRRAYAPVGVAARLATSAWHRDETFRAELWAWSDRDAPVRGSVTARLLEVDGGSLAQVDGAVELAPGPAVRLGDIALPAPLPALFLLDLALRDADEAVVAANRYLLGGQGDLSPLVDVPPAVVRADIDAAGDGGTVRVRHVAGPAALGLRIEDGRPIRDPGWAVVDDGWFDLLPGETRDVLVRWTHAGSSARALRLSGWNVAETRVPA
jgi:beta-mannosidase